MPPASLARSVLKPCASKPCAPNYEEKDKGKKKRKSEKGITQTFLWKREKEKKREKWERRNPDFHVHPSLFSTLKKKKEKKKKKKEKKREKSEREEKVTKA